MKVYIDTSVFGGYFDKEFDRDTKAFFSEIEKNKLIPVVSELTITELNQAPDDVKQLFNEFSDVIEFIFIH